MKRFIKEVLSLSRTERNGFTVLLILIFLLILLKLMLPRLLFNKPVDYSFCLEELKAFEESLVKRENPFEYSEPKENLCAVYDTLQLCTFDPNEATKETWKKLGLTNKQINTIYNYKAKGGRFVCAEDLSKIYGLSDYQYKMLRPYVLIKEERMSSMDDSLIIKKDREKKVSFRIELNTADSLQLILLKGIGPVFAHRIIKYRELLGGYYNLGQLQEVYGLPQETITLLESHIIIDTSQIIKIDLNEANYQNLIRHPYIDKYQVEAILQYRDFKGSISNLNELIDNHILTPADYKELRPYLIVK